MPGLLSNIFGDGADGEGQAMQDARHDDASGEAGLELSPSITVSHDASGSYQNPDGSTTEWSSHTDITLTADVDAAVGAVGALGQADSAEG